MAQKLGLTLVCSKYSHQSRLRQQSFITRITRIPPKICHLTHKKYIYKAKTKALGHKHYWKYHINMNDPQSPMLFITYVPKLTENICRIASKLAQQNFFHHPQHPSN